MATGRFSGDFSGDFMGIPWGFFQVPASIENASQVVHARHSDILATGFVITGICDHVAFLARPAAVR